jgi:hypothetical protein
MLRALQGKQRRMMHGHDVTREANFAVSRLRRRAPPMSIASGASGLVPVDIARLSGDCKYLRHGKKVRHRGDLAAHDFVWADVAFEFRHVTGTRESRPGVHPRSCPDRNAIWAKPYFAAPARTHRMAALAVVNLGGRLSLTGQAAPA